MNSSNLVDDTLQTILLFTLPNPLMVSSEEGGGTLICRYDGEGGRGVRFENCKVRREGGERGETREARLEDDIELMCVVSLITATPNRK